MGKITLITGGVRSGKSSFALSYAQSKADKKAFIATAIPFDDEMRIRVDTHRSERGELFDTIEEPYELPSCISVLDNKYSIAVVDCLTVWLGNLFYKYEDNLDKINYEIERLQIALLGVSTEIILVTNEVGWGIVPENKMARVFRDTQGTLNQKIAKLADCVILSVSGIPVYIKGNESSNVN